MLNIPETVKALYKQDGVYKNFRCHFPDGELPDITNDNIVQESVQFTESICSQDVFKFGLAEASTIEFETVGVGNMYGMTIECSSEIDCSSLTAAQIAEIEEGEWDGEYVPLADSDLGYPFFRVPYGVFRVESCPRDHQAMTHRKVEAYTLIGGKELKNKYEEKKNELMLPNALYTPDLTQILMSTVNQNIPGGLTATGYTENAPQQGGATIYRSILKKTAYTDPYSQMPIYAELGCMLGSYNSQTGSDSRIYADSMGYNSQDRTRHMTLMDSDTMVSMVFNPIESGSGRVTVEEAYEILAEKINDLIQEYNQENPLYTISLSLFGYTSSIDFVRDAYSSKTGFYFYGDGYGELVGDNIETGGPNPNALGEFSYPSIIYWPGKTYDISTQSNATRGAFAGPVNAINFKESVHAFYPYREYNKKGVGICAIIPNSLCVKLHVRAFDSSNIRTLFEKTTGTNVQTATFKRYDSPSGASPLRASFEPTLDAKKALSATKKINCFSFANAYSLTDILNGQLELTARFILQGRDGNVKMVRLSDESQTAVAPGDFSKMWWDEYDVDDIGTVRFAFADKAGEEQIEDYRIGDGNSIYDMTDNETIMALASANPDTVKSLLDTYFVPHLGSVKFTPVDLTMKGLPYIEAGDAITVTAHDGTEVNTYVLRNEISGIQSLEAQIDSESGMIIDSEEAAT